jgi:pectate lyase
MNLTGRALISAGFLSIGYLTPGLAAAPADPGREVLSPNDGFAATPTSALPLGTTGGSNAAPARTVTVTNRNELVAALRYPDATPKLIYVKGMIDANVDDDNTPLNCRDYLRPDPMTGEPFSLYAFESMYDPASRWGRKQPAGGQENARRASAAAQEKRVHILVPPNTTLYGVGSDAALVGAWLDVRPPAISEGNAPMNVIIRNISFEDAADCFPEWSPDDGPTGNWNSAYDSISIRNATHVWIDHNRFADVRTRDETQPTVFNRRLQVHDGLVDISNESDFVTVSWNQFAAHDKTMLIGNSDGALGDRGKLHVTLHHNYFDGVGQRAPRVRFGQVHVYNNLYRADLRTNYHSSWGAGFESLIYAENNFFDMSTSYGPMEVIDGKKGSRISTVGNCWRKGETCEPTDFVAVWNARFDPDLNPDVGWVPELYARGSGGAAAGAEAAAGVRARVLEEAGPRKK